MHRFLRDALLYIGALITLYTTFGFGLAKETGQFNWSLNDSLCLSILLALVIAGVLTLLFKRHYWPKSAVRGEPVALKGKVHSTQGATVGVTSRRTMDMDVVDYQGKAISSAQVAVIPQNRVARHATTDASGKASLEVPAGERVTLLAAHSSYGPLVERGFDSGRNPRLTLSTSPDGGSTILTSSTGYVDGVQGRLNPHVGAEAGDYFIYIDDAAVVGKPEGPVHFSLEEVLLVQDQNDVTTRLIFLEVTKNASLIEYHRA